MPEASPTPAIDPDEPTGFCNKPIIDKAAASASAETEFTKGELSNRLVQVVVSYGGSREASKAFEQIQQLAQGCSRWDDSDTTSTSKFTLQSLSFPKLGDETLAFRMAGEIKAKPDPNDEFSLEITGMAAGDVIIVRSNNLITVLGQIGIGIFGPPSLDSSETEVIARKAVERLENV